MISSAINDYKNGIGSIKTLSKTYGVSVQKLKSELILNRVEIRGRSSTKRTPQDKRIIELFKAGKSIREISSELGIADRMMISSIIKLSGATVDKRRYSIDETVFEAINSEHKAYWLGFLYADGCIRDGYTVQLRLNDKDSGHIQKFKDFINYNGPSLYDDNYNSCTVSITSKKMYDDLTKLGCFEKKTYRLVFPTEDIVPKQLIYHFIRGFFDGDGHIGVDKSKTESVIFNVVGTLSMVSGIRDLLLPNSNISKSGNIYDLRCKGNVKSFKVLNTIYQDATIYLDRKFELYNLYKTQYFKLPSSGKVVEATRL